MLVMQWVTSMGGTGLEQSALTPPKTPISKDVRTECGTLESATDSSNQDLDLQFIIERWPYLPNAVRSAILAIARASSEQERG